MRPDITKSLLRAPGAVGCLAAALMPPAGCAPVGPSNRATGRAAAAPCFAPAAPACLPPEDRQAEAWLSAMTLDEKIMLVSGTGFDTTSVPGYGAKSTEGNRG